MEKIKIRLSKQLILKVNLEFDFVTIILNPQIDSPPFAAAVAAAVRLYGITR